MARKMKPENALKYEMKFLRSEYVRNKPELAKKIIVSILTNIQEILSDVYDLEPEVAKEVIQEASRLGDIIEASNNSEPQGGLD